MRTLSTGMAGLAASLATIAALATHATALAHGSIATPVSRIYNGFLEGPESPKSAAVQAAIAIGGTQPFYDWNELVNFAPGSPAYQMNVPYDQLIPDGELASGGNYKYRGLDQVRDDWPTTAMQAGPFELVWYATTPHDPSVFHAWITKPDWNPTMPLTWAAMEPLTLGPVSLTGNAYRFNTVIPARTGKHCIYVVWQRLDPVGEGFYSVSDVDFGDGGEAFCPGDLNADQSVGGADLGVLLGAWGTPAADLNGDGTTNGADLGEMLSRWGICGSDCDGDGVADAHAILHGLVADCDANLVPDSCDFANGGDADGNGVLDACQIDGLTYAWSVPNQWSGGFIGSLRITNGSSEMIHHWQLQFTTPGYTLVNAWDCVLMSQANGTAMVHNETWNGHLGPGASVTIGYQAAGAPGAPTQVLLNGSAALPE